MTRDINVRKTIQVMMSVPAKAIFIVTLLTMFISSSFLAAKTPGKAGASEGKKIYAQKLVEEALAKHPEVTGVEMAATPPQKSGCVTIAATEAKEVGEKCDKDEFTAMRTGKPFAEKEKEGGKEVFDVTVPLYDAAGKTIGTLGMDFKPEPGQEQAAVTKTAQKIATEIAKQIPSKSKLFEESK